MDSEMIRHFALPIPVAFQSLQQLSFEAPVKLLVHWYGLPEAALADFNAERHEPFPFKIPNKVGKMQPAGNDFPRPLKTTPESFLGLRFGDIAIIFA
jgi:hypothetical protein